jgi:hypothetical protein
MPKKQKGDAEKSKNEPASPTLAWGRGQGRGDKTKAPTTK